MKGRKAEAVQLVIRVSKRWHVNIVSYKNLEEIKVVSTGDKKKKKTMKNTERIRIRMPDWQEISTERSDQM